jgi:cytoskeletal protein CcmA (bactofilin family)
MERNVIAKNTTIIGEIKSDGDFRIDGSLEGDLKTKGKVIIGAAGFVKGSVTAANADVEGKISGKLIVEKTLTVKSIANISGEVIVGKLSIEPGAAFNASCIMKAVINNETKPEEKKPNQKQPQTKFQRQKTKRKTFK